jgi:hypothetical protein
MRLDGDQCDGMHRNRVLQAVKAQILAQEA